MFFVQQGYIASTGTATDFSEAVIIHYDPHQITLHDLIEIHLLTHKSTSNHSFRKKYRSAIYHFTETQQQEIEVCVSLFRKESKNQLITQVLKFHTFKPSRDSLLNYYKKNPNKPFCERYITPKLEFLKSKYEKKVRF